MLWNLLSAASGSDTASLGGQGNNAGSWVMIVIMFAIIVVFMIINRRSQKKRSEEAQNTLNALRPGNKVKTVGGICGVIVEVDEDTFVLETGSETMGKSYITFDKRMAIYQTDAVAQPQTEETEVTAEKDEFFDEPQAEEQMTEEQTQPAEETVEETTEATEENVAEETEGDKE